MTSLLAESLASKITSRDASVVVVGLGYIGLPLLVDLERAGFRARGFDVDHARIASITSGKKIIEGVDAEKLSELVKHRKIKLDHDPRVLSGADIVVLCVPTPFVQSSGESGEPDMHFLWSAVTDVIAHAHSGMLVVLESTSYPGTTREIAARFSEAGFSVGETMFVACSPERIDPGNRDFRIANTTRVVGGITPACTKMVHVFYKQIVAQVKVVTDADTAEVVKLLENTFRAVNVGLVNELAVACKKMGVDIWEVVDAASTKPFGFMKFSPGPGVGGPCVPVAPRAMAWKMGQFGDSPHFLGLATTANQKMPAHVARLVEDALADEKIALEGAHILIAGVAYKPDVADLRGSPALELVDIFTSRKSRVSYIDSHVPSFRHANRTFESINVSTNLADFDAVVLVTAHTDLDVARLVREATLVIDTRNATCPFLGHAKARVVRL
ncbi:MAG: nucleotide sugar dehydrogenase [Polyangiaceae bacterium]